MVVVMMVVVVPLPLSIVGEICKPAGGCPDCSLQEGCVLLPGKKPGLVSFAEMGNTLTYSTHYTVLWESLEDLTHWPIYPAAGSIPHCKGYPTLPLSLPREGGSRLENYFHYRVQSSAALRVP